MAMGRFGRRQTTPTTAPRARGWVGAAYGQRAQTLVSDLADRLHAAADESAVARSSASEPVPAGHARDRLRLEVDLTELRQIVLSTDVTDENHRRDQRLRASLAVAIGAARSLALSSPSQPKLPYFRVTQAAVDDVLVAADERVESGPRRAAR
jgi:hypothetical protein